MVIHMLHCCLYQVMVATDSPHCHLRYQDLPRLLMGCRLLNFVQHTRLVKAMELSWGDSGTGQETGTLSDLMKKTGVNLQHSRD